MKKLLFALSLLFIPIFVHATEVGPFGEHEDAYIEIYLDQSATTTRSITSTGTDLDFVLTYISDTHKDFVYNDTSKEITYLGGKEVLVKIQFNISMERTDTGGTPEMQYFVQHDSGSGYSKSTKSIVAREYTNLDVGTASNAFLFTLSNGDKLKMGLRTNLAIALDYRNIVVIIQTVRI